MRLQAASQNPGASSKTAVVAALMAKPSMILLDELSMAWRRRSSEEIFEIVKDLNSKEGVSFRWPSRTPRRAEIRRLRLHPRNGRVVMDGAAADPASTMRWEFYRHFVRPQELPRRQDYRRRKRWLA